MRCILWHTETKHVLRGRVFAVQAHLSEKNVKKGLTDSQSGGIIISFFESDIPQ